MHRIEGDGYLVDSGKKFFDDENPPTRFATQVTHQWANAVQEEIAKVIEAEGLTLNAATENKLTEMTQLNSAINLKVAAEATARIAGDAGIQSQVTALKKPLNYLSGLEIPSIQSGSSYSLAVSPGACLDDTNTQWIIFPATFNKRYLDVSGNLEVFAAGPEGAFDPGSTTNYGAFTCDWAGGPTDLLTDISIDALVNMKVGDILTGASLADFPKEGAAIIEVISATSVRLNSILTNSGNDLALNYRGRWIHVFALGKSTDAAAYDIGMSHLVNPTYFSTQGWNLKRRIGSVFVKPVGQGIEKYSQYGDNFVFSDPFSFQTLDREMVDIAALEKFLVMAPYGVRTEAELMLNFTLPAVVSAKDLTFYTGDGAGNYAGQFKLKAAVNATTYQTGYRNLHTSVTSNLNFRALNSGAHTGFFWGSAIVRYKDHRGRD